MIATTSFMAGRFLTWLPIGWILGRRRLTLTSFWANGTKNLQHGWGFLAAASRRACTGRRGVHHNGSGESRKRVMGKRDAGTILVLCGRRQAARPLPGRAVSRLHRAPHGAGGDAG